MMQNLPVFLIIFMNRYSVKATVYLTLGRLSTSLEETFYIVAVPDPRVPMPADEDLPKVLILKLKS